MFWAGEKILKYFGAEKIVQPFDQKRIDCNAYALSVGPEYFLTSDGKKRIGGSNSIKILKEDKDTGALEGFSIPTGQFAYLITEEVVKIPKNTMGFISLKTKKAKFKGLVNISGFHVDPGYHGQLTFSVFNAGPSPIHFKKSDTLFLLWVTDIDCSEDRLPFSSYTKNETEPSIGISSSLLSDVADRLTSLQEMSERIRSLENQITRIYFAAGAVAIAILVFLNFTRIADWLGANENQKKVPASISVQVLPNPEPEISTKNAH